MSTHFKQNLKAYASLVGAVVTALSTNYHNPWLTGFLVVVTAVGTWSAENAD